MKEIITIGLSGFPYGMAATQKLFLMGKAIVEGGYYFTVVSHTFVRRTDYNKELQRDGKIDQINYIITSPYVFTPDSTLKKIYGKLSGFINELKLIIKRRKNLGAILIYSMSFPYSVFYGILCRILNLKVYLVYFELRSSCSNRIGYITQLNDKLFDRFIFHFVSGVITISDNLVNHIKSLKPGMEYIIVPPLVDFRNFRTCGSEAETEPYFLYCGTLAYSEVIEFILESYLKINDRKGYKLYLVLNGSKSQLDKVKQKAQTLNLNTEVRILTGLEYSLLVQHYCNAHALLIPLRNTPQDISRFPQKVAEYCASGKPIISTRFGEMVRYFDDNSVIFADDYNTGMFAEKMEFVINNKDQSNKIAKRAYDIGEQKFDYKSFSKLLIQFINNNRS